MRRITTPDRPLPLHSTPAARRIEQAALASHGMFELMARAGLSAARWALAQAPHARSLWVAAGPGNNGGDGLVMARHWHTLGRQVHVSFHGDETRQPADARQAMTQAREAGVSISEAPPPWRPDLSVDALLGLGQQAAPRGAVAEAVAALNHGDSAVLSLDLPTGLCGDTGTPLGNAVKAQATLSLLSLKPGLFTGHGRDHAGALWWDTLGCDVWLQAEAASAYLGSRQDLEHAYPPRPHASHKGRFGDCWVIGGTDGMTGAVQLAARAALLAGAGRVYLCPLANAASTELLSPELMLRTPHTLSAPQALRQATVVCGCGGGDAVAAVLPTVLHQAPRLVLDADALNAISSDAALLRAVRARASRNQATVLTPHPLEAARLLQQPLATIQRDRLGSAQQLAQQCEAVVVLKGSGTVIAAPGRPPIINPSGNARLASAGTGDVLAGWIGGNWSGDGAAQDATAGWQASVAAVLLHGLAVEPEGSTPKGPLPASALTQAMADLAQR